MEKKTAFGGLSLILILNAVVLSLGAFRGFLLLDFGAFLDGAWRILKGQIPYADFYYTTGPVHLYLHALFFFIFGFGKTAILIHLIALSSAVILLTFFAVYRKIPLPLVLAVTLLQASGYFWTYPHPWYDHTAHLWGIIAVFTLIRNLPFQSERTAFQSALITGAMAMLAFMTKSNIGGAYGLVFFIVCLSGNFKKRAFLGFCAGNLISFIFAMILVRSPQAYFENVLFNYGLGATRQIARLQFVQSWFKNLYWLPALIIFWLVLLRKNFTKELVFLFFGIAFAAIFSLNTGSLRQPDHLPLAGIFLGLGFILLQQIKTGGSRTREQWQWQIASVLFMLTVFIQLQRTITTTVQHVRGKRTSAYSQGNYALKSGALAGWKFEQEEGETLDKIIAFINQEVPKKDSLLILSDMLIVNALTGRESFKNIPFIWDPGVFPAPGKQVEKIRANILEHPPDWIMIYRGSRSVKMNMLLPYLGLPNEFLNRYRQIHSWGNYGMYRHQSQ